MDEIGVYIFIAFWVICVIVGIVRTIKKIPAPQKAVAPSFEELEETNLQPIRIKAKKYTNNEGQSTVQESIESSVNSSSERASNGLSSLEKLSEKEKMIIYSEIMRPKFDE